MRRRILFTAAVLFTTALLTSTASATSHFKLDTQQDWNNGSLSRLDPDAAGGDLSLGTRNWSDDSLVGYWRLDETSDPFPNSPYNVTDYSGNGNNGTAWNGTTWGVDGVRNSTAFDFDGSNDYVEISNSQPWAQSGKEFSISAWVKSSDSTTSNMAFVGNYHSSGQTPFFMVGFDGTDAWFWLRDTGSTVAKAATPQSNVVDGTWHHITGVRDQSANEVRLYVDGVLEGSDADSTGDTNYSSTVYLMDHNERYTNGTIDEVKIYNRSLSNASIRALYNVSDFTPVQEFEYGSNFSVNNTNNDGKSFSDRFYQYKVNMLTGDSSSVPAVERVTLANTSGWSSWVTDPAGSNVSVADNRYGQAQFNLSSTDPVNSSVLHQAFLFPCGPPGSGDWIVDTNCTISRDVTPPANVDVKNPNRLNVTDSGAVDVDFLNNHLLVRAGARVLIDALGKLY